MREPFVSLLGGNEPAENVNARWVCYSYAWDFHQSRITKILDQANERAVNEIKDFVLQSWDSHPDSRIAAGLVLPGSNIANHFKLFDRMKQVLKSIPNVYVVSLNSKDVANLKTAVSLIVKTITEKDENGNSTNAQKQSTPMTSDTIQQQSNTIDEFNEPLTYDKRLRYDLEILADWCKSVVRKDNSIKSLNDIRIVVSIDDAHSFDSNILAGLIKQMQSYISQIPFKLILSVATSIDVFQENTKRSCIRMLEGTTINAHLTGCLEEVILDTVLETTNPKSILIGPHTFRNIIRRQRESLESIDSYVSALKYTYMTYFYSNPLSIIPTLHKNNNLVFSNKYLTPSHYAAVRLLPSFQTLVETLAETDPSKVRPLIEDDSVLLSFIKQGIDTFNAYKNNLLYGIMVLEALQQFTYTGPEAETSAFFTTQPTHSRIDLYSAALLGEIPRSEWFEFMCINYAKGGITALVELLRLTDPNRDLTTVWPCTISPVPPPFAEFHEWVLSKYGTNKKTDDKKYGNDDVCDDGENEKKDEEEEEAGEGLLGQLLDFENGYTAQADANDRLLEDIKLSAKFVYAFRDICKHFFDMLTQKVFPLRDKQRPKRSILEKQTPTYSNALTNGAKSKQKTSKGSSKPSSSTSSTSASSSSTSSFKPIGSAREEAGHWYKSYFLHELFVVDIPALQENVFSPTYRAAIDMALSNPKHYWGDIALVSAREKQRAAFRRFMEKKKRSETANANANSSTKESGNTDGKAMEKQSNLLESNNGGDEDGINDKDVDKTQRKSTSTTNTITTTDPSPTSSENEWSASSMAYDPHLSIMYTLYRESAMYINIYDFYTAFMAVIKQPQDADDPLFERKALAWFLQGVAELKSLGVLRDSKRKFECVEKLVWRDL